MFHVKIEIEQHKNGISLQYKTRNNSRNPDVLFSSDGEKTQFLDLFPQKSKINRTPQPVLQSNVLFNNKYIYYFYCLKHIF